MLPRRLRLTKTPEYRAVYEQGRSCRGQALVCLALERPGEPTRVGIVASRRVGGAVQRNRAKRRLREAVRGLWQDMPATGHHLVLVATSATPNVDWAVLVGELRRLLAELELVPSEPAGDPGLPSSSRSGSDP